MNRTVPRDICVCCGQPVPEGRMVCRICQLRQETHQAARPDTAQKRRNRPSFFPHNLINGFAKTK